MLLLLPFPAQTRARLGLGRDKTFVPTPNVRNPQMLAEAEDFEKQMLKFEESVRTYHAKVQSELVGTGEPMRLVVHVKVHGHGLFA
jgi:hypothetical protein